MNIRTLAVAFALVAVSFGARSQEILEEPGPYVPLGQDVTDISAMISEGRISEALDSIDVLMAADSLDDALYYYRGQCLIELNKYGEAAAAFKRALELDPDNSSYYERLYSLYDAMRLEEAADSLAMEMFERSVKLEKSKQRKAMAYHNMGVIMQKQQQYGPAMQQYMQALRLAPHSNDTRYNYVLCQRLKKDENNITVETIMQKTIH